MAADLTIMEEAALIAERLSNHESLPFITSCCPSWVKFVEDVRPGFLSNLSPLCSPQQLMGRIIKKYITSSAGMKPEKVFVVSVEPCTSRKYEAELDADPETGIRFVDAVITTRELSKLIRLLGIDFSALEPEPGDTAFSTRSSSGKLFGAGGGHLEGLIRTIHYNLTGQELTPVKITELRGLKTTKETRLKIGKQMLNVAAVSGLAEANKLLDEITARRKEFHIIEVMACPFGCINGGGQNLNSGEKILKSRMKTIYDVDEEEIIKVAHKNPIVSDLYEKLLVKPGSARNRDFLYLSRNQKP
jgi:iron only hydrogenase large subunit-like protein